MANIVNFLETNVSEWANYVFRERSFFEGLALPFFLAAAIQICSQYYSFNSECEYIASTVIIEASPSYKTYGLALIFEVFKASIVGIALRLFFAKKGFQVIMLPLFIGLGLSYGSWWMSDQGTIYIADRESGDSPASESASSITASYDSSIKAIISEIDSLETYHFYWCEPHQSRHKCDLPDNTPYVNPNDKGDRLAQARIAELRKQKDKLETQRGDALALDKQTYATLVNDYSLKKNTLRVSLEGKVLVAEMLVWLCSCFIMYVLVSIKGKNGAAPAPKQENGGADAAPKNENTEPEKKGEGKNSTNPAAPEGKEEAEESPDSGGAGAAPKKKKKGSSSKSGKKKKGKNPSPPEGKGESQESPDRDGAGATPSEGSNGAGAAPNTGTASDERKGMEEAFAKLLDESPSLAEEMLAMAEKEKKTKGQP